MGYIAKKNKQRLYRQILMAVLGLLIISAITLFVLDKTHVINIYSKPSESKIDDESAKTTSKAPSAQEYFTGGDTRIIKQTDTNEGVVVDTNGNITNLPSQDQWTKSESGNITLYTPGPNAIVQNASIISGEATVSKISFRLIDNVSGVIARGELNVINGKFSGTFDFNTSAVIGRLDVFSIDFEGLEINNIELPISFR